MSARALAITPQDLLFFVDYRRESTTAADTAAPSVKSREENDADDASEGDDTKRTNKTKARIKVVPPPAAATGQSSPSSSSSSSYYKIHPQRTLEIQLYNREPGGNPIAYVVRTSAPSQFIVQNKEGLIPANGGRATVKVSLRKRLPEIVRRSRLLVQYTAVNHEALKRFEKNEKRLAAADAAANRKKGSMKKEGHGDSSDDDEAAVADCDEDIHNHDDDECEREDEQFEDKACPEAIIRHGLTADSNSDDECDHVAELDRSVCLTDENVKAQVQRLFSHWRGRNLAMIFSGSAVVNCVVEAKRVSHARKEKELEVLNEQLANTLREKKEIQSQLEKEKKVKEELLTVGKPIEERVARLERLLPVTMHRKKKYNFGQVAVMLLVIYCTVMMALHV